MPSQARGAWARRGRAALGSAELTTGITNDSCGFSVGPSPGVVRFIVEPADVAFYTSYTFEALVAESDGSRPSWLALTRGDGPAESDTFEVYPEGGSKLRRILDVRLLGQLPPPEGCSIARRPR